MNILHILDTLFGIHAEQLSIGHMIARVLAVYVIGILLARFNKRFLSFRTANNFYLFILIGSILAASIVGPLFYETLGMAIFIIFFNWFVSVLEFYIPWFNILIQGRPIILIDQGVIQKKSLNKFFITELELMTLFRARTNSSDLRLVEKAYLENNGEISFILKN